MNKRKEKSVVSAAGSHDAVRLVVAAGLAAMLGSGLVYFVQHPELIVHEPQNGAQSPVSAASVSDAGLSEASRDALMQLMQRLQADPQDLEALNTLAAHFLHTEDFARAENFALRAVMTAQGADAAGPLYMVSMAQHSQGRHGEAAASLEKSLSLKDDAESRYSLGILYRYFLKDEARGRAELNKALAAPGASNTLKQQIAAELDKPAP